MLFRFCQSLLKISKTIFLRPLIWVVDKVYVNEVHSKHEKIASDVNSITCTPSAFLDKPREEQLTVLAVDVLIHCANFMLMFASSNNRQSPSLFFTITFTYFAMDFATGMWHFCLDDPSTKNHHIPTVKNLAWQFQDHHDKPYDNTLPPLFHILSNFSFLLFPAMLLNIVYSAVFDINMTYYNICVYFFAILSQYVHRSIHYVESQRAHWVIVCMNLGLLQSVTNHHKHHKTFDCHYATLSGWTDPILHWCIGHIPRYKHNNPDLFGMAMRYMFIGMPLTYIAISKLY